MFSSERQLEDYVYANLNSIFGWGMQPIARQLRVKTGIIDILAYMGTAALWVIELKLDKIKPATALQVSRYAADIAAVSQSIIEDVRRPGDYPLPHSSTMVRKAIIGRRIDEEAMMYCGTLEITTMTYDDDLLFKVANYGWWTNETAVDVAMRPEFDDYRLYLRNYIDTCNQWARENDDATV